MNGPKKIRELFASKKTIVAPGAHDMLTAKIIGRLGFDAVYMTGYGQSASHLGKPDVGLMTMSEMVARAANMVECAGVPVIADADTGFGNAVNVMRTVREYEKAGVAVIQLEDQVMPKKCGHMVGREVIPMEEMVGKIKAAVDARVDPNFMIMARTDARTVHGIDAALERAHAYKEAGTDILFVESPESEEEMRRINEELPGCLTLANMVEGGRTPMFKNAQLSEFGYNLIIYPTASVYVTTKAMVDLWEGMRRDDTTETLIDTMIPFAQFNEIMGLPEIRAIEANYATGRVVK
ncbi:isocitrate lyase/PEP mutase family protein [Pseudoflavonifractor gallinarum]|uniref:isocitrate lyase/PEP mutase family protein n=1 Tax=Pseudoflavonifractor gallinarum TaxID=2779352 RepID=UPI0036F1B8F5